MKKYIVIQTGCLECGWSTTLEGVFDSPEAAGIRERTLNEIIESEKKVGQYCAEIFEIDV